MTSSALATFFASTPSSSSSPGTRKSSSEYICADGFVAELFHSARDIEATRAQLMQEALAAGFYGHKSTHPHWRYVRHKLFQDDPETMENTARNATAGSSSSSFSSCGYGYREEEEDDDDSLIAAIRRSMRERRRSSAASNAAGGSSRRSSNRSVRFLLEDGVARCPGQEDMEHHLHSGHETPSPPQSAFHFSRLSEE